MGDNNIHFNLHVSKEEINKFIDEYIQQYNQHKITADSYEITLKKPENSNLNIHTSDCSSSVIIEIPLDFTFYKRAGLFSVEGDGSISVCVEVAYDILPDLTYTTTSSLLNYKWLQKPIVHLGTFNMPAEILGDVIIHFMKDNVLSKLDEVIKGKLDLKALLAKQWQQYATNFTLYHNPKLYFNAQLNKIISHHLKSDKTHLNLDLFFDIDVKISDNPVDINTPFNPTFVWKDVLFKDYYQEAFAEFTYKTIANMALSEINGLEFGGKKVILDSINIVNSKNIQIKANLLSPIEGMITIVCHPVFDKATQMVQLQNLDVKVNANNLIYKMVSPVIESTITKKIHENTPLNLKNFMDSYIKKIPEIQIFNNRISLIPKLSTTKIDNIQFLENSLMVQLTIEKMEVDVVV